MSDQDQPLLRITGLKTWFGDPAHPVRVVDDISFDIFKGETFALLGESGCGKSMTALSMMQLVPSPAGKIVAGEVHLKSQDLLQLSERQMRTVRGKHMSMIFQEPMTSLNPVLTIGEQIAEVLRLHSSDNEASIQAQVIDALNAVGIPDPQQRLQDYPHQLSGGMKQRVMIAIALAAKPELLIADEPTTALDVTIQAQVMDLLRKRQNNLGMAMLLITHDLGIVADRVDRLAVMYAGELVEQASREEFFNNAAHPYSRKLFAALPNLGKREQSLETIKGNVPALDTEFKACRFADRCDRAWGLCHTEKPQWHKLADGHQVLCHLYAHDVTQVKIDNIVSLKEKTDKTIKSSKNESMPVYNHVLMQAKGLKVHFPIRKGLFRRISNYVYAVDNIDLELRKGRTLALVGESGCGKTTAGKALLQLIRPTAGRVSYLDNELTEIKGKALQRLRAHFQIIFQDPYASLNPRMMVGDILEEGMQAQNIGSHTTERQQRIDKLLEQVGLPVTAKYRYPHEFSGGQRQRISIARALAVEPDILICDEPTSALDVSVQAQTLNLLKDLQDRLGLSYLFITHNISVVEYLAHEIAVMYLGRIVEQGPVESVLSEPQHPYTQALLSAVPVIDKEHSREVIKLEGELPSPINPPEGCHFHPRCPQVKDECKQIYPEVTQIDSEHQVRCHLY
ncbi:MAG: ABC transporter ATP-binding protein [Gammaproteobacteria bacterium]|nr:ABC transporter ATP-binding protein [Gammaproteobacteria bacterium]